MRHLLTWIFISLLACHLSIGQTPDYELQYKKALQTFKKNDFEKARLEFNQVAIARIEHQYTPYAYYFSALSSFNLNKYVETRNTLRVLLNRFTTWDKRDDAILLLTQSYFEENDYIGGITAAKGTSKATAQEEMQNMKAYYIRKLMDVKILKDLNTKFPDDPLVTKQYKDVMSAKVAPSSATAQDKNKDYFNFGVLLPFNTNGGKAKRSNYALDMYQGMRFAKTQLQKEGINVNFMAYDVANDADYMIELLNNKPFRSIDLLFGPLFSETNKLALTYCQENQIPLINPMSNNKRLTENYKLAFLAEPSSVMQAKKAANFVSYQGFSGRTVAIYYTETANDSAMAYAYRDEMENRGYSVSIFEKMRTKVDYLLAKNPTNQLSHIFLATSDKKAGLAMLALLDKLTTAIPLITTEESFSSTSLSSASLEGKEIYCVSPEYMDVNKPETDRFRKDYLSKAGILPSYYVLLGYDLGLFWGRLYGKYGYNVRKGLDDDEAYKGEYTLSGFDYRNSQDNQICPITALRNYKFVLVK
ncbi:MAG: ABC transporter substrate-binding protein [Flectobacillus sp.]|nr:ABC transporter substrate-binding protein [Flectobacillus sp.]